MDLLSLTSVLSIVMCAIMVVTIIYLCMEVKLLKEKALNNFNNHTNLLLATQKNSFDHISNALEAINRALDLKLLAIQDSNSKALEHIRATMDERLYESLDKKLGASFALVSQKLEQVFKGLGEMQVLANGVGDLKKVLSNVKVRGVWAETQLANLLEQIMHKSQYETNIATKHGSTERVEFAIKIPSIDGKFTWLPIDAKFPLENYQRIVTAQENGDPLKVQEELKLLETFIKTQAKQIAQKYIDARSTTDFAIMFLPIEGLYAEVLRIPNLCEFIQANYRIVITSASTLIPILFSLQMSFKTIALQRSSDEVWKILAMVKSEFFKFADTLAKTKTKLEQATQSIGDAESRTRVIHNKLNAVEKLDMGNYEMLEHDSPSADQEAA